MKAVPPIPRSPRGGGPATGWPRDPNRTQGERAGSGGIVLIADPAVLKVPVADNGEPLVDVAAVPELAVDDRLSDPHGDYRMLRSGVVDRLRRAAALLPDQLRICVVEGYRPIELQKQYFEKYCGDLLATQPTLDASELEMLASRVVAPPDSNSPHATGGAVDLTLCDRHGRPLDMGSDLNQSPEQSAGRCYTRATDLPPTPAANRRLLVDTLEVVGMVNYPTEWWHWSYGDRYWALSSGTATAPYGPAIPRPEP